MGNLTAHHRFLLSDLLVHLDFLDEQITKVEERIEAKLGQLPLFRKRCAWSTLSRGWISN